MIPRQLPRFRDFETVLTCTPHPFSSFLSYSVLSNILDLPCIKYRTSFTFPYISDLANFYLYHALLELKKAKDALYASTQDDAEKRDHSKDKASGSIEEADARRMQAEDNLDTCEKKLALCKKELNDAITKYRLLVHDTARTREAEKESQKVHLDVIENLKTDQDLLNEQHDQEVAMLNKKNHCLQTECVKKDEIIDKLKDDMREVLLEKNEDALKLIDAHGKNKKALAKELSTVVGELDDAVKEKEELKNKTDDVEDRAEKMKEFALGIQGKLEDCDKNCKAKDKALDDAKKKIDDLDKEKEKLKDQVSGLRSRLDSTQRENSVLHSENMSLKDIVEQVKNEARSKGDDHEKALQDSFDYSRGLENTISALRAELAKALFDRDAARADIDHLKQEVIDLKAALDKANIAKDAAVQSAMKAGQVIETLLKEQAAREETFRNERNALLLKIEDLLFELEKKKEENRIQQIKLDRAQADKASEIATLMALHAAENEAAQQELQLIKSQLFQTKASKDALEENEKRLKEEKAVDKAIIDDLKNQLRNLRDRTDGLVNENNNIKDALAGAQAQIKSQQDEINRLLDESASLRNRNSSLEQMLASQKSTLENKLKHAGDQLLALKGEREDSQTRDVDVVNVVKDLKDLQKENQDLKKKIPELEKKVFDAESKKKAVEAQLEAELALSAANKEKIKTLTEQTATTKIQRLPPGLQEKIDHLTLQLRAAQQISQELQSDMVPVEETITTKSKSESASESSSSETISTNYKS